MSNSSSRNKRRRWPWVVGAIVAIIVVAPLLMRVLGIGPGQATEAAAQGSSGQVVEAFIGNLSAGAMASGNIEAHRGARLSLEQAGTVKDVPVSIGDAVKQGDPLVVLDTAALERAVSNAQLNLTIQEANLQDLLNGSSGADLASAQAAVASAEANLANVKDGADPNDIRAARANVASAQAAYDKLIAGPDSDTVAQAEANLKNAQAALSQAQAAYDRIAGDPDVGMKPQALELQKATNNYQSARSAYDQAVKGATNDQIQQSKATLTQANANLQKLLNSPTATELAAAESQLAQAQAQLDNVTSGASSEKTDVAQAQVEQARLNLQAAKDNLDKATLRAPFDGVITAVHVAAAEQASGLAVEMADTSKLEVVLSVDEVDVGNLTVGQPAIVTLETWPGQAIKGEVVSIAPRATTNNSAIVSYEVRVALGETDLPVRIGMTADAELIIAAHDNVLLVPSQAITANRNAGTYSVKLVTDGPEGAIVTSPTEVTIGLKDGDNTEIKSGLQAGDRVLIGEIVAATPQAQPGFMPPRGQSGGNPFGG